MQSFSELPISKYTRERLSAGNFVTPTPVQAATIPQALEGKDVLATAQTGTGKTLAFLIPVIERLLQSEGTGIAALALVPTRELAMQVVEQYNALRGRQLGTAALVVGGLAEGPQLQALRRGARLVVATPGRLEDYISRKLVHFRDLNILVLDEADRMLDMGFLPAIKRIAAILPPVRQTLCFSATLEASVAHLVRDYMRSPVRVELGSILKPSENVRIQAFEVSSDRKRDVLRRLLTAETGRCLVFARTKRGTQKLALDLSADGFAAAMIHGGRSQSQRNAALAGFQRGRYRVLVATDVASRGIHVQDIAHVINYDMPEDAESFIHRAGRTGRAGERGIASTLFGRDQRSDLMQLERKLGIQMERMQDTGGHYEKHHRPAAQPAQDAQARPERQQYSERPEHSRRGRAELPRAKYAKSGATDSRSRTHAPRAFNASADYNRSDSRQATTITRLPGETLQLQTA